jgi:hypothetical protein
VRKGLKECCSVDELVDGTGSEMAVKKAAGRGGQLAAEK